MTFVRTTETVEPTRRMAAWPALAGCGIALLLSFVLNIRAGTNTDVSWIITIIEGQFSGKRLYVDILETNPPFSVWLYYPAVAAARILSMSPEFAVAVFTYLVGLASLGFTHRIARKGGLTTGETRWWFWPGLFAVFLVLPGTVFAQREHIGLMALLPLLVLQAWRLNEGSENRVPVLTAIAAGVAGSVIILVKPHWALSIGLPALYVTWSRRSVLSLLRPEYLTIAAIAVAYLAIVIVAYPEFLGSMYPMLQQVYMPISNARGMWLPIIVKFAITLVPWILLRVRGTVSPVADLAALSSMGFFAGVLYLGKGWGYHLYPSLAMALIASLAALEAGLRRGGLEARAQRYAVLIIVVAFVQAGLANHVLRGPDSRTIDMIRASNPNPTVAVIGADIGLAFPLTRMVGGNWSSAYCSDWAGAHALLRLKTEQSTLGARDKAWLETFLSGYIGNHYCPVKLIRISDKIL
ncbi:hypothetical protein [Hoeflea sp.]|uniref:hypothetical protein n=1 Tax=Hoeflea sp. TaxID=1940281 RepID=UPI003B025539